jgi:hypothetical protein
MVIVAVVLTSIAAAELAASISHSAYDSHENRAPEARIVVAGLAVLVGLSAIYPAVARLRRRQGRTTISWIALAVLTAFLVVAQALVVLASGPL